MARKRKYLIRANEQCAGRICNQAWTYIDVKAPKTSCCFCNTAFALPSTKQGPPTPPPKPAPRGGGQNGGGAKNVKVEGTCASDLGAFVDMAKNSTEILTQLVKAVSEGGLNDKQSQDVADESHKQDSVKVKSELKKASEQSNRAVSSASVAANSLTQARAKLQRLIDQVSEQHAQCINLQFSLDQAQNNVQECRVEHDRLLDLQQQYMPQVPRPPLAELGSITVQGSPFANPGSPSPIPSTFTFGHVKIQMIPLHLTTKPQKSNREGWRQHNSKQRRMLC